MRETRTSRFIAALCLMLFSVSVANGDEGADAPAPVYAQKDAGLEVVSIRRIWSGGEHNAFPDVARFSDSWFVATREATAHGVAGFGRVRIMTSDDGRSWRSVASFDGFGDYRRAELSVTPDGRLMVLSKFNPYRKVGSEKKTFQQRNGSFTARDHAGNEQVVHTLDPENHVAFSDNGKDWTEMQPVEGTHPRAWFYSGVQWRDGVGYAIDRQNRVLYRTGDGVRFERVSDVPVGNESRISFLRGGTMIVFFRNGSLARSKPPYQQWSLNERNKKGPHSYGGPGILALPGGEVWAASRHRIDPQDFAYPEDSKPFPDGTVLFKLEEDRLAPKLLVRGGGDRGYNGLSWHDGFLWMAYNAPSRELRKSCIYFAKIKLD